MNNILIKFSLSKGTCSLTPKICNYFATKMQATSTNKTKDSAGRRLGVKKFGGEEVFPNDIIIRQRGFKWKPGKNIIIGKDHTFHSKIEVFQTNIFQYTIKKDSFFRGKSNLI